MVYTSIYVCKRKESPEIWIVLDLCSLILNRAWGQGLMALHRPVVTSMESGPARSAGPQSRQNDEIPTPLQDLIRHVKTPPLSTLLLDLIMQIEYTSCLLHQLLFFTKNCENRRLRFTSFKIITNISDWADVCCCKAGPNYSHQITLQSELYSDLVNLPDTLI
jgi:hypothetical protein